MSEVRQTFTARAGDDAMIPGLPCVIEYLDESEFKELQTRLERGDRYWEIAKVIAPRIISWSLQVAPNEASAGEWIAAPSVGGWEQFLHFKEDVRIWLIKWIVTEMCNAHVLANSASFHA